MKAEKILLILGASAAGYFIYQRFFSPAARSGNLVSQYADPKYRGANPGTEYPFKAPAQQRVDNQSEPWYGGMRNFLNNPSQNLSQVQVLAQNLEAVGSISESVSSIWANLDIGSWWSDGDANDAWPDFSDSSDDYYDMEWA